MLNLYPRNTIANLDGESNVDIDLIQGLLQYHGSGVRLLSAPLDATDLVELSTDTWQQILRLLGELAAYVVVDTSAHADPVLSEMLSLANDIIVITGADIAGLRDARILLQSLRHENVVEGQIHLVLNRAGTQGGLDERVVHDQLREAVAVSLPEDAPLATYAFNRGVPFVLSHQRALMTRRLNNLTDRLLQGDEAGAKVNGQPQRASLLSFMRRS